MEEKAMLLIILIVALVAVIGLILEPAQKSVVEKPGFQEPEQAVATGTIKFSVKQEAKATGRLIFETR